MFHALCIVLYNIAFRPPSKLCARTNRSLLFANIASDDLCIAGEGLDLSHSSGVWLRCAAEQSINGSWRVVSHVKRSTLQRDLCLPPHVANTVLMVHDFILT